MVLDSKKVIPGHQAAYLPDVHLAHRSLRIRNMNPTVSGHETAAGIPNTVPTSNSGQRVAGQSTQHQGDWGNRSASGQWHYRHTTVCTVWKHGQTWRMDTSSSSAQARNRCPPSPSWKRPRGKARDTWLNPLMHSGTSIQSQLDSAAWSWLIGATALARLAIMRWYLGGPRLYIFKATERPLNNIEFYQNLVRIFNLFCKSVFCI